MNVRMVIDQRDRLNERTIRMEVQYENDNYLLVKYR